MRKVSGKIPKSTEAKTLRNNPRIKEIKMEIRKDCKVEETNVKYTKDLVTKTKYL
jgi:hypothetical protein